MSTYKEALKPAQLVGCAFSIISFKFIEKNGKGFWVVDISLEDNGPENRRESFYLSSSKSADIRYNNLQRLMEQKDLSIGLVTLSSFIPKGHVYPTYSIRNYAKVMDRLSFKDALYEIGEHTPMVLAGRLIEVQSLVLEYAYNSPNPYAKDQVKVTTDKFIFYLNASKTNVSLIDTFEPGIYEVIEKQFTPKGSDELITYYTMESFILEDTYSENDLNNHPF